MEIFTGVILDVKIKSAYIELLINKYNNETKTIKVNDLNNDITSKIQLGIFIVCYKNVNEELFKIIPLNDLI